MLSAFSIILALISFYFDKEIVKAVSLIRNSFLTDFFLGITFVSSEVIVFFFLTSLFLWREHKRKWVLPLWFTLAISVVVGFTTKYLIKRPRPFQQGFVSVLPVLQKASHDLWNFSFPSFQAMLVFCAVPILSKQFPRFRYIWITFAGLVAFSRVYFGVHFLSDVIIGGLIGYLIGIAIIKLEDKTKLFEKIYKKVLRS